jgi:glycosyltransferase involved in cell wall biosynthesis
MAGPNVLFTGTLEHRHLVHLIALADVTVVPSIFPETFGMVAAEAAAGGSIPLVARHSGLAEIAEALGSDLTSFDTATSLISARSSSACWRCHRTTATSSSNAPGR